MQWGFSDRPHLIQRLGAEPMAIKKASPQTGF